MFARFVCSLLSLYVRKFLAKSKTREPGEIIMECTLYTRTVYPYITGSFN